MAHGFQPQILKFSDGRVETLHDKTPEEKAALLVEHEAERRALDPAHAKALDAKKAAQNKPEKPKG